MNNQEQPNKPANPPAGSKPKKIKKRTNTKRNIFLVIQVIVVMGLMGLFAVGGAALGYVASIVKDQKPMSVEEMREKIYSNALTSFAYFNDGTPIGKLPAAEDRRLVTLDEISSYVIEALISTEDKTFREHSGISFKALTRAVLQKVTVSDKQTGGSTITQQLVKVTLLEDMWAEEIKLMEEERKGKTNRDLRDKLKMNRKFNEIFLAMRVERYFSKDQILEAYLNENLFGSAANGSNLYGIQAAAKGFFGVDAKDLNLPQSAYLVGALNSPATFNPFKEKGLEAGTERMKLVLGEMLKDGKITQDEFNQASKYDIKGNLAQKEEMQSAYDQYPFLVIEIWNQAAKSMAESDLIRRGYTLEEIHTDENKELYNDIYSSKQKELVTKGYHIYTTIDKELYDAFNAYASDENNFMSPQTYKVKSGGKEITIENALQQVGAILIENKTGKILANLPGRDFKVEQTNHVYAPRQPGSAMKPIAAFAPAFEEGVLLSPESPIDDSPIVLNPGKQYEHTPMNVDDKYHGILSARTALSISYNIPAIREYLAVGIPTALEYVKKLGITTIEESDYHSQTGVIGGLARGTTVEEISNAYATFANGGTFVDAYMVERIEDKDGEVIYEHQPISYPVFSEQTSWMINDMLKTAYSEGTGRGAKNLLEKNHGKHIFASKTGTTNNWIDLWFVGYNPNITLGVWTGFDVNHPMPKSHWSRDAWVGLMSQVLNLRPELSPKELDFTQPDGLVRMEIDSKSGKLPSELSREAGHVVSGYFKKENVPTEIDDMHVKGRVVIVNEKSYLAHDSTPDDMVVSKIFLNTEPLTLPEKMDKPLSKYLPLDWMDRLPTDTDPREDDGMVPSTTTGLNVKYDSERNINVISWIPNLEEDIVGYRLYRYNGFTYDKIASILSNDLKQYEDTTGDPHAGYYITAVDLLGQESEPSSVVTTTGSRDIATDRPSTPINISASSGLEGLILSWQANHESEQVYQYNIYHSSTQDGDYSLLTSTPIATYIRPIVTGEVGWYKVSAVNLRGESEPSRPITVETGHDDSPGLIDIPIDSGDDD